jgi:predicted nucleic acid-binding protein
VIVADAAFWVAAFLAQDAHHDQCARLLRRMVIDAIPVSSPTLALVEVAGALVRRTGSQPLAESAIRYLNESKPAIEQVLRVHPIDLASQDCALSPACGTMQHQLPSLR